MAYGKEDACCTSLAGRWQPEPLIRTVDAIQIHVPYLEAGLRFYRDQLGHEIVWRTSRAIRLRLEIQIGRCAVVRDPRGAPLVLLDASKGLLITDTEGNIIGNRA